MVGLFDLSLIKNGKNLKEKMNSKFSKIPIVNFMYITVC